MDPAKAFPVGGNVAGVYTITERLGGERWSGRYRARDASGASYLVTTGGAQTRPLGELMKELELPFTAVARLRHIAPLSGDPNTQGIHAMVEDEPAGQPASALPLPLGPEAARALALEVCRVLDRLHVAGVVLGGLSPELVYASEAGGGWQLTAVAPRATLFLRTATLPNFPVRPPFPAPFRAPEMALAGAPTPAADVFAVGLLLAYWLSGQHPFEGRDFQTRVMAINFGRRRALSLPAPLDRLVDQALERSPDRRISFSELMRALGG